MWKVQIERYPERERTYWFKTKREAFRAMKNAIGDKILSSLSETNFIVMHQEKYNYRIENTHANRTELFVKGEELDPQWEIEIWCRGGSVTRYTEDEDPAAYINRIVGWIISQHPDQIVNAIIKRNHDEEKIITLKTPGYSAVARIVATRYREDES